PKQLSGVVCSGAFEESQQTLLRFSLGEHAPASFWVGNVPHEYATFIGTDDTIGHIILFTHCTCIPQSTRDQIQYRKDVFLAFAFAGIHSTTSKQPEGPEASIPCPVIF